MARPLVVLVLSADGVTRRSCEQGLTVWGFEVLTASTGPEALYLMDSSRRIDVLVTDAELEGEIDGLAVAQLARERNPKVQLIYSAEYPHRIPRARMIDGSPCFRSPYGAQQIAGVINAVISRRAMPEAA
jgi:CheY-like chemotaxis protein